LRAACAPLLVFALALALAGVGCAETTHGPLAGASDAWKNAPEPTSAPNAPTARAVWERYGEVLRMPIVTSVPFTTRGHLPAVSVDVRANDLARPHYASLVADTVFPDGALLAELPRDGISNGYAMGKDAGVWSYFELDAGGTVLASGTPPLCVGCHAQGPSDHVFGLPRAP